MLIAGFALILLLGKTPIGWTLGLFLIAAHLGYHTKI